MAGIESAVTNTDQYFIVESTEFKATSSCIIFSFLVPSLYVTSLMFNILLVLYWCVYVIVCSEFIGYEKEVRFISVVCLIV
jgi:hypothetical protein